MKSFYCQLDYEHVPYPSPVGAVNGNIANNGCGVCSASMLVENMLDVPFPVEEAAKMAKACGAREGYGTNLYIFAPVFAAAFGMKVRDTEDGREALRFLQEGRGMVIANTYGDRPEHIGVFSDGGHYIVLAEARRSRCGTPCTSWAATALKSPAARARFAWTARTPMRTSPKSSRTASSAPSFSSKKHNTGGKFP